MTKRATKSAERLAQLLQNPQSIPVVEPDTPHAELAKHSAFQSFSLSSMSNPDSFLSGFMARDVHIRSYGFVVLPKETLDALAELFGTGAVLEVGAGSGYLAHRLHERGVRITASDCGGDRASGYGFAQLYRRDHEGDSVPLLPGAFDHVLMAWPPLGDPLAAQVAAAMVPGQVLVFQGEGAGGCTADAAFYNAVSNEDLWERLYDWDLRLDEHHLQFQGIHDRWYVFRRR